MNQGESQPAARSTDACAHEIPREYRLSTYNYDLPSELIAQEPLPHRDDSCLMVIHRGTGTVDHCRFTDLPSLLSPSDLLVVNETKVIPAMLIGRKKSGGRVELLVLDPARDMARPGAEGSTLRTCLVRSSKPLRPGAEVEIKGGLTVTSEETISPGRVNVRFPVADRDFLRFLNSYGQTPLPRYIRSGSRDSDRDRSRYQTVYASTPGSVAAPTAGLHFTDRTLEELNRRGIEIVRIVLHVGPGTFTPVREEDTRLHRMEEEYCAIQQNSAQHINRALENGRRVIAVGTTTVRTLESAATDYGRVRSFEGKTSLFIQTGYSFKVGRGLLTNFHLPRSTLLMLVCAFAGLDLTFKAYDEAVCRRYRFYSYGDACLILD